MSITLWDEWSERGPEFSKRSSLYDYKTIGLAFAFDDADIGNDHREAQWVTALNRRWYESADNISYFQLEPPKKNEIISWHEINRLLNDNFEFFLDAELSN